MNQTEYRKIALGAIRSQARRQHIDPTTMSADDALAVMDDISRVDPQIYASVWYDQASDAQMKQFKREWNAWKRSQGGTR